ncbi:Protein N-acetyltransferase, RimJ/RimL family [Chitinophaga eiseniae]|uniref:Protein N-acetyltransferase, RimJ/RimL family n=1 Tax=Chitinophaga eiseniae TaxID=634771 RepID=A0A1T4QQ73_9BACT|nr:GNAT family N-acetyltransferase [Chitinophaga eiseniae]SKA05919.1 Protein N-acetyltransferase, RimJ/RimL family [Chitinophaga eiseniae]
MFYQLRGNVFFCPLLLHFLVIEIVVEKLYLNTVISGKQIKVSIMPEHPNITLRKTVLADLEIFFVFQLDQEANHLAAFTSKDPTDKAAYIQKYTKHAQDPTINMCTIFMDDVIVGSIAKFEIEGQAEITYWIDKKYWGQGVATSALKALLANEPARPILGRVAFDNLGSQKVMEKCGFIRIGEDKGFANARQAEIEEYIYKLM